jgi:hypothetical protein
MSLCCSFAERNKIESIKKSQIYATVGLFSDISRVYDSILECLNLRTFLSRRETNSTHFNYDVSDALILRCPYKRSRCYVSKLYFPCHFDFIHSQALRI